MNKKDNYTVGVYTENDNQNIYYIVDKETNEVYQHINNNNFGYYTSYCAGYVISQIIKNENNIDKYSDVQLEYLETLHNGDRVIIRYLNNIVVAYYLHKDNKKTTILCRYFSSSFNIEDCLEYLNSNIDVLKNTALYFYNDNEADTCKTLIYGLLSFANEDCINVMFRPYHAKITVDKSNEIYLDKTDYIYCDGCDCVKSRIKLTDLSKYDLALLKESLQYKMFSSKKLTY